MMKSFLALLLMVTVIFSLTDQVVATEGKGNSGGILYTKPLKAVLFTHRAHVDAKKISCERCHSGLFEMEALKVQEKKDFNMESLYKGKYCGVCHNGKSAFASNTQCARCHLRVTGEGTQRDVSVYKTLESFGSGKKSYRFNHETHSEHSKCGGCHPKLFRVKQGANKVTFDDHGKRKYCFACHDGKKAFSWNTCRRCHTQMPTLRTAVSFGKGEKVVSFQHSTHLSRITCSSCHTRLFPFKRGGTKISFASHSSEKACFSCHREKDGAAFYSDCSRCHKDREGTAAAQQGPGPLTYQIQGAGPVNFVHKSHGTFACDTCHPKLFIMKKGGTKMSMTDMYQGKSCGTCHDGVKAFPAMACAKCHK